MWKTEKLGKICNVRRGTTITKKNTADGEVPVIGGGTKPTYFHNVGNREAGCITVSGSGASSGYVNFWDVPIFASDCSTVEILNKDTLQRFVYYFMMSQQEFIYKNFRSGAAQPHVYAKDIASLDFPILPVEEQHLIVAKLDKAFFEIDEITKVKNNKIENIQRLSNLKISGLVNNLLNKFTKTSLSDVCVKITKGSSPKWQGINYVDEQGVLFITSENVGNNKLRMEKIKYVENKFNEKESKSILKKGDVLTNIVGASIGRTTVFDLEVSTSANINQAVCLIRTDGIQLNPHFLSTLLNSEFYLNALHGGETSTARANISLGFVSKLEIPLPSLNEQNVFLNECKAITEACSVLIKYSQKQNEIAEKLKSTIISHEFQNKEAA